MNAIHVAIKEAGGITALAKSLKTSPQRIDNWVRRGKVPAEMCPDIERATNGAVTVEELRPDLAESWAYLRSRQPPVQESAA